jgi:hypothetical protein
MRMQSPVLALLGFLVCMIVAPSRAAADPVRLLFSFTGDDFSGSFTLDPAALQRILPEASATVFKGQTVLNVATSDPAQPAPRERTRGGDLLLFVNNGFFQDALFFIIEPFNTPLGSGGEFQGGLSAEDRTARGLSGSGLPDFTRLSFEPFTLRFGFFDHPTGLEFGGPLTSLTVTPLPEVPEPSTVLLLGGGLAATIWRARRSTSTSFGPS